MNEFKESLEIFNENLYFNYMVKSAMICGKKSVKIKLFLPHSKSHKLYMMTEKIRDKGYIINELNTEYSEAYSSVCYLVHWD